MIFCIFLVKLSSAQQKKIPLNTKQQKAVKSISVDKKKDTVTTVKSADAAMDSAVLNVPAPTPVLPDSVLKKMSKIDQLSYQLGIKISTDALPAKVITQAKDSAIMDVANNRFLLFGAAELQYEDIVLQSGKLDYNQANQQIKALPSLDSNLAMSNKKPIFKQGAESFTYDSLIYNFKQKKAIVRNAHSQYGEGFVISDQVKRNADQSIYGWQNIYTTCALEHPHFGIRAKKIKVVPDKIIATGTANLMIADIPTPLFLPFGVFPIAKQQSSGFKIPGYTMEVQRGLGITNGGYYFNLNRHVDLLFLTNIYSKGSWGASAISNYNKRYHYNGGISLSYAYNKIGEAYESSSSLTKDFMINWRHQVDAKATPGMNFSANVVAGTSSYYANNSYSANQILNNQYQSNISFSKNWINKPYSLTISARHSQNTRTRQVNVTLPEMNFYLGSFNPFQNKKSATAHWYDKINMSYNMTMLNQLTFYDTSFNINAVSLSDFRNGMKHVIPIGFSTNILRFINFSTNINYTEYWLTERNTKSYNDITSKIDTAHQYGFFAARDISASATISSRIYGVHFFKKGKIAGIRHVITPSIGAGFIPDYATAPFNYYYLSRMDTSQRRYYMSPYEKSLIGVPGLNQYGRISSAINFNIQNNLQLKVRNGKDSASGTKNVSIIDGLSFSSSYNVAADSFNWSVITAGFRTNLFQHIGIAAGAVYDPYAYDYVNGRRKPQLLWDETSKLAKLASANMSLNASFHSTKKDTKVKDKESNRLLSNNGYSNYIDFNIPWNLTMAYSINLSKSPTKTINKDTLVFSQTLMMSGDFNLTKNFKIAFSSGYDFVYKQLTFTSIDIYRDLHCWEMRINAIPFGPRKSYSFTLNVKSAILQDLKLLRRRDFRDAVY
ncbi:MAG: LPS-assembly protein LptD [Chitinophagia bacterium]|nr:LPS-assembly protein LptD [Chitinophagia bacterium]